jgi:hypothetical protein
MHIKEWISMVFPVIPLSKQLSKSEFRSEKREAVLQLISIGDIGKIKLDEIISREITVDDKTAMMVCSVMLGAYAEVLMSEFKISKSDLLSPDAVIQKAKDLLEKEYKLS